VIIDLPRFVGAERPYWDELNGLLGVMETEPERRMGLPEIQRLHYLYERCSADLSQLDTFATDPALRSYLESLVSKAYSEIHETRAPMKFSWKSTVLAFPRAFRRHLGAFQLAVAITLLGCAFGWFVVRQDPRAKAVLLPFSHLAGSPKDRVAQEEAAKEDRLSGRQAAFGAYLMTHNIQVTILVFALGLTWGFGTTVELFFNGVILGAVCSDYIASGEGVFLTGWLLPHGAAEIPSILLGGQAGFILANALIGWGGRTSRAERLRAAAHDLFAIMAGAACLLIWAGTIESFVSQYHQPAIPYSLKILFGVCELAALTIFLGWAGRER